MTVMSEGLLLNSKCIKMGLKRAWEVCVGLHDHGNHNSTSQKSCSSITGSLFYSAELNIVFFFL